MIRYIGVASITPVIAVGVVRLVAAAAAEASIRSCVSRFNGQKIHNIFFTKTTKRFQIEIKNP